ncbi:hypothetical protein LEP1GSC188_3787 [Leptospira weilii serovar Topaz str. LT2116]|uniref:Uncharacterized protein n=1 Tax=Leptospira weilii serovar Topaz str. LT2116 TaxID=1088540 RepID=M3FJA3_9LEPT|nr:hypothetical protein LEP1GSC188_3787 [Leptospira weilii serovar Topaz str. LT2116]
MEFLYSLVFVAILFELEIAPVLKKTEELFKVKDQFSED